MKQVAMVHTSDSLQTDRHIARTLQWIEDFLDHNKNKDFLITIEEVLEIE